MKVFSVLGRSKTGKTTTIEIIIRELIRRGYTVGSVKDIHFEQFAIDTEGTNTFRHRQAGAEPVTARGGRETDVLFGARLSLEQTLGFYHQDYVVLEGADEPGIPKIVTGDTAEELDELADAFTFAVSGKISARIKEYKGIPAIDATAGPAELVDLIEQKVYDRLPMADEACCQLCGFDCITLGQRILAGESSRDDCRMMKKVSLRIDGRELEMVPFVQQILKNAVRGVAGELKGYQKGRVQVEFYDE
ncbi:MAG: molybdopterin-guanine dinucleotide biosynthesis protein B [Oscillospiraceae bacterium]|nr:molybdopterin-guanine dinucleotide biosynthesis protein B [Oscillospiraceae bacterium]